MNKQLKRKLQRAKKAGTKLGEQIPASASYLNQCYECGEMMAVNVKSRHARLKCVSCRQKCRCSPDLEHHGRPHARCLISSLANGQRQTASKMSRSEY